MPLCEKCGAFVGKDGKWAPAEHLLRTSEERDKAVKAEVELRWAIGGMNGHLTKASLALTKKNETIAKALGLLTPKPGSAAGSVAWALVTEATELLNGALSEDA